MQKTKKSIVKRFKVTATGKLLRRKPGKRHLLSAKNTKQRRRMSQDQKVSDGHAAALKKGMPFA
ncbi:MAG: 50S ribosomal protein L35 [Opitutales bacterium]|nr:50S ribosomal protein L35 [Opitutales bacterium]